MEEDCRLQKVHPPRLAQTWPLHPMIDRSTRWPHWPHVHPKGGSGSRRPPGTTALVGTPSHEQSFVWGSWRCLHQMSAHCAKKKRDVWVTAVIGGPVSIPSPNSPDTRAQTTLHVKRLARHVQVQLVSVDGERREEFERRLGVWGQIVVVGKKQLPIDGKGQLIGSRYAYRDH